MIVAMALLRYDMKLAGGATERYPNVEFAHMVSSSSFISVPASVEVCCDGLDLEICETDR